MTYEMDIAGLKRRLALCKLENDTYTGAFVLFGDVELTVECASEMLKIAPDFDYLIAPEAKSIPLIYEMARQSGENKYFVARKKTKLYMREVLQASGSSAPSGTEQTLYLDKEDARAMLGKRILIVDDIISAGDSLSALERLVEKAGGIVAGSIFAVAVGRAAERGDIQYLAAMPLFDADGTERE